MFYVRTLLFALIVAGALLAPYPFQDQNVGLYQRLLHAQETTPTAETPFPGLPTPTGTPEASVTASDAATETATAVGSETAVITSTDTAVATATNTAEVTRTETTPFGTETPGTETPTATPSITPTPSVTPVSEVIIDAAGGTITSPGGHAQLTFPPGATDERLLIRVADQPRYDAPPLPESEVVSVWEFDAFAVDRGWARVSSFEQPVIVDLTYKAEELWGRREDQLRYWTFDSTTARWTELETERVAPYHWQVELIHFSPQASSSDGVINLPPTLDRSQVDLNAGALTYQFPMDVVPAIGGLEPSLTASYSSARVDEMVKADTPPSWVGLGWELTMPSITKQSDGNTVKYFLNIDGAGGELVNVSGTTWYLRDHQFISIQHNSACDDDLLVECPWTIQDQSGRTYLFGGLYRNARRYYPRLDGNQLIGKSTFRWDLEVVTDLSGNRVDYFYLPIWAELPGNSSTRWPIATYPSSIEYGTGRVRFELADEPTELEALPTSFLTSWGYPLLVRPDVVDCRDGYVFDVLALDRVVIEAKEANIYRQVRAYDFDTTYDDAGCQAGVNPRLPNVRLASINSLGALSTSLLKTEFSYTTHTTEKRSTTGTCGVNTALNTHQASYLTAIKNGFGGQELVAYQQAFVCDAEHFGRMVPQSHTLKSGTSWASVSPDVVTQYAFTEGPKWIDGQFRGWRKARVTEAATGTYADHTFIIGDEPPGTMGHPKELAGRTSKQETRDQAGTLLETVEFDYRSTASGTVFINQLRGVTTTLPGAPASKVTYEYESTPVHGRVLYTTEDGDTSLTTNDDCRFTAYTYHTMTSPLLVLPMLENVRECGGNDEAEVAYYYDGAYTDGIGLFVRPNAPKGNLTAVRRSTNWALPLNDAKKYVWTFMSYEDDGRVRETYTPQYGPVTFYPQGAPATGATYSDRPRSEYTYDGDSAGRLVARERVYVFESDGSPASVPTQEVEYGYTNTSFTTGTPPVEVVGTRRLSAPSSTESATGLLTEYAYDEFGRIKSRWQPSYGESFSLPGADVTYGWTGGGGSGVNSTLFRTRMTAGQAATIDARTCFDGWGRERQTIRAYGGSDRRRTQTVYNATGRLENSHTFGHWNSSCTGNYTGEGYSPNNYVEYDALGNPKTITNSEAGTPLTCSPSCVKVEVNGRRTTTYDEENHKTESLVDGLGRVVKTSAFTGNGPGWTEYSTMTFEYDARGNLTKSKDQLNNATDVTYDGIGRRLSMKDPDMSGGGRAWTYTYDAIGNVITQRDARAHTLNPDDRVTTHMTYDSLGRLRTRAYTLPLQMAIPVIDPGSASYTYDEYDSDPICPSVLAPAASAIGQRTKMVDQTGVTRWCYDTRGREIATKKSINLHPTCGTTRTLDIRRTYDAGNRLKTLTYPDPNPGDAVPPEQLAYVYDDTVLGGGTLDRIESSLGVNYLQSATYHPTGVPKQIDLNGPSSWYKTTYSLDGRYRLSGIKTENGGPAIQDLRYSYFEDGNLKNAEDAVAGENLWYAYDELDRLTEMRQGPSFALGSVEASYEYAGAAGKIGNITRKVEGTSDLNYSYTDADHKHAPTNLGSGPWPMLSYDANGNLAGYVGMESFEFDAANRLSLNTELQGFGLQNEYLYDGDGNLVRRHLTSSLYPGVDQTDIYFGGLYEERIYGCTVGPTVTFYEAFGRILALRSGNSLQYLLADRMGSSVASVSAASGSMTNAKYWPFGSLRSGVPGTDKAFTGQQRETTSTIGAYDYGARFYSTEFGVFLSVDPAIGSANEFKAWNSYSYVMNNPLRYVDPTGMYYEKPGDAAPPCRACHELRSLANSGFDLAKWKRNQLVGALQYVAYQSSIAAWANSSSIANGGAGDCDAGCQMRAARSGYNRATGDAWRAAADGYAAAAWSAGATIAGTRDAQARQYGSQSGGGCSWCGRLKDAAFDTARLVINSPVTAGGLAWGELHGGDCGYAGSGTFVCSGMGSGDGMGGGMTIGNVFLTEVPANQIDDELLDHERRHSTQWAWFGGNPVAFSISYGIAQTVGRGACGNVVERDAGLEKGNYNC